jgi:hypothetical protein
MIGGIYSRGQNLRQAYSAVKTDDDVGEEVISNADEKIPILNTLRNDVEAVFVEVFNPIEIRTEIQVRVYSNGRIGHPRHTDEQSAYVEYGGDTTSWVTTVSGTSGMSSRCLLSLKLVCRKSSYICR